MASVDGVNSRQEHAALHAISSDNEKTLSRAASSRLDVSDLFQGSELPPRTSVDDPSFWEVETSIASETQSVEIIAPSTPLPPEDQHPNESDSDQASTPTGYGLRHSDGQTPGHPPTRQSSRPSLRGLPHSSWSVESLHTQYSNVRSNPNQTSPSPSSPSSSSPPEINGETHSRDHRYQLGLFAALEGIIKADVAVQTAKEALTAMLEAKASSGGLCPGCVVRLHGSGISAAAQNFVNGRAEPALPGLDSNTNSSAQPHQPSLRTSSASSSSSSGASHEDDMGDHLMAESSVESAAQSPIPPVGRSGLRSSSLSSSTAPGLTACGTSDLAASSSSPTKTAEKSLTRAEEEFRDLVRDWSHKDTNGVPSPSSRASSQPQAPFIYDVPLTSQWSPDDEEPTMLFRSGKNREARQKSPAQGDFESALSRLAPAEGVIPSHFIDHSGRYLNLGGGSGSSTGSDKVRIVQIPSPVAASASNPLRRMSSDDDFASRSSHGGTISAQPSLRRISEDVEREEAASKDEDQEKDDVLSSCEASSERATSHKSLPSPPLPQTGDDVVVEFDSLRTPVSSPPALSTVLGTPRKATSATLPTNDDILLSPSSSSYQGTPAGTRVLGSMIQHELNRPDSMITMTEADSPAAPPGRHRAFSFPPVSSALASRCPTAASAVAHHEAVRGSAIQRWTSLVNARASAAPSNSPPPGDFSPDRLVASRWSSSTSNFDLSNSNAGFQLRSDLSTDLAFGRSPDHTAELIDISESLSAHAHSDGGHPYFLPLRRNDCGPTLLADPSLRPLSLRGEEIPPVTANLKELRRLSLGGKSLSTVIQEAAAALKSEQSTPHGHEDVNPMLQVELPRRLSPGSLPVDMPPAQAHASQSSMDNDVVLCASPQELTTSQSDGLELSPSSPAGYFDGLSAGLAVSSRSEAAMATSSSLASTGSSHWLGKRLQKAASHFSKGGHMLNRVRPHSRSCEDVAPEKENSHRVAKDEVECPAERAGGTRFSEMIEELLPSKANLATSERSVRRSELSSRSAASSFISRQLERAFLSRKAYHEDVLFEDRAATAAAEYQERPANSSSSVPQLESASGETTPRPHAVLGTADVVSSSSIPLLCEEPVEEASKASGYDSPELQHLERSGTGSLSGCGDYKRGSMLFSLPPLLQDNIRPSFDERESGEEERRDGQRRHGVQTPSETSAGSCRSPNEGHHQDVSARRGSATSGNVPPGLQAHGEATAAPLLSRRMMKHNSSVSSDVNTLGGASSSHSSSTHRAKQQDSFSRSFPSLPAALPRGRRRSDRSDAPSPVERNHQVNATLPSSSASPDPAASRMLSRPAVAAKPHGRLTQLSLSSLSSFGSVGRHKRLPASPASSMQPPPLPSKQGHEASVSAKQLKPAPTQARRPFSSSGSSMVSSIGSASSRSRRATAATKRLRIPSFGFGGSSSMLQEVADAARRSSSTTPTPRSMAGLASNHATSPSRTGVTAVDSSHVAAMSGSGTANATTRWSSYFPRMDSLKPVEMSKLRRPATSTASSSTSPPSQSHNHRFNTSTTATSPVDPQQVTRAPAPPPFFYSRPQMASPRTESKEPADEATRPVHGQSQQQGASSSPPAHRLPAPPERALSSGRAESSLTAPLPSPPIKDGRRVSSVFPPAAPASSSATSTLPLPTRPAHLSSSSSSTAEASTAAVHSPVHQYPQRSVNLSSPSTRHPFPVLPRSSSLLPSPSRDPHSSTLTVANYSSSMAPSPSTASASSSARNAPRKAEREVLQQ